MINVIYNRLEVSMTLSGHAGYAEPGKDIVCAGASALIYAVPEELRSRGFKYFADAAEKEGFITIKAYPSAEERHSCLVIFDTVFSGLKELARNYPQYVHVEKEERTWLSQ